MKQLFQITVADERGVVVDTGWVAVEVPIDSATARPLAGSELFDEVLGYGLEIGIEATKEDAVAAS